MTGVVFSNIMLAALPEALDNNTIYISPNAAPSSMAGKDCNPLFFAVSWPNDAYHEAAGAVRQPARAEERLPARAQLPGRQGFARRLQAHVQGPDRRARTTPSSASSTTPPSSPRSAPPSRRRCTSSCPAAWASTSSSSSSAPAWARTSTLLLPGFSADQDVIKPVGEAMSGLFNTAHWSPDFANAANQKFMAEFQKEYKRMPTLYASQGYDAALLINAAVRDVKGKLEDQRRGAQGAAGGQVRLGARAVQVQHQPVPDPELLRAHGRQRRARAALINKSFSEPILQEPRRRVRAGLQDEELKVARQTRAGASTRPSATAAIASGHPLHRAGAQRPAVRPDAVPAGRRADAGVRRHGHDQPGARLALHGGRVPRRLAGRGDRLVRRSACSVAIAADRRCSACCSRSTLLRTLYARDHLSQVLATFALILILNDGVEDGVRHRPAAVGARRRWPARWSCCRACCTRPTGC